MTQMTRAQRAAVGPQGGKQLVQPLTLTPQQEARLADLKAKFGKGVGRVLASGRVNRHMYVRMVNANTTSIWEFDVNGSYVTRYTQRALFDDTNTTDTA